MKPQQFLQATHSADSGALMMPLSDLQPYEHNPRHGFNAEYQRIKSSIRSQGLDQPLVVTQRPGENHYVPLVGGNTRLKILQELYQETRDERFGTVNCVYRPWTEESHVLLAHLRENELRGSLIFIDKALAILDLKAILESESPHSTLTLRGLAKIMTQRGLGINHTVISKMVYAVERLLPLIPEALNAGLGRPQVEKLQALENAFLELWYRHALGPESECAEIFAALCQRYDSPDWNLELLRTALENEVAEATDTSLHSVRLQLDALLSGSGYTEVVLEPLPTAPEPEAVEPVGVKEPSNSTQSERRVDIPPKAAAPASATVPAPEDPLVSLRVTAYTLAARLAEHYGLAVLVVPLRDQGLGFMLTDVPPPELRDTLDPALFGEVSCLWWQLAACAELTTAPANKQGCDIRPDAPVSRLVRVCQGGTAHAVTQAHAIEFADIGTQGRLDIAEAFPPSQLREGQYSKLLGAGHPANPGIAGVAIDYAGKAGPWNKIHDLCEQCLADIHMQSQTQAEGENYTDLTYLVSNRHHMKSAAKPRQHWVSA